MIESTTFNSVDGLHSNIKEFFFLNAVFLMLKYVDEENNEYPATAECAVLAMQKTPIYLFPNIAGALSVHTEQITLMSR